MDEDELLSITEAGRILNRCAKTVRQYDRSGRLPTLRTRRGMRLFRMEDVKKLAQEIQQASLSKNKPA
jgi:predicted site-specific integrase-resolvase